MNRWSRLGLVLSLSTLLAAPPTLRAHAAETVEIPVLLPLTGSASFLGNGERQALQIAEKVTNDQGGINGTTLRFSFRDDQSSPQVAVQQTQQIVAGNPSVLLGSAIVAMCNAMAPLVAHGPMTYCLSPGVFPLAGSFVFTSFISTHDLARALVAYYRGRGFTRIGMITSTDASGQDGARGFTEAMALPENQGLSLVAAASFNPTDVSVSAQVERLKSTNPQALIVWTSGAPFGTVLKGIVQGGLEIPVGTTDANMTFAQMKQYAAFLPAEMLYMSSEWPEHDASLQLPAAVGRAQSAMFAAYKAAGVVPDIAAALAWDPAMLVIEALRKLGAAATAEQVRLYVAGQTAWAGVNGVYDFSKMPQRGLDIGDSVVTRWSRDRGTWLVVSKPGGDPL